MITKPWRHICHYAILADKWILIRSKCTFLGPLLLFYSHWKWTFLYNFIFWPCQVIFGLNHLLDIEIQKGTFCHWFSSINFFSLNVRIFHKILLRLTHPTDSLFQWFLITPLLPWHLQYWWKPRLFVWRINCRITFAFMLWHNGLNVTMQWVVSKWLLPIDHLSCLFF